MTQPELRLETLLRRDRWIAGACLLALTLLAWGYLVLLAAEMAQGDMGLMGMGAIGRMSAMTTDTAMGMAMAPQPWTAATFALMALMWWVMMIGMMIPSAAPMILLYARVLRRNLPDASPASGIAGFTLGYLLAWAAFSAAAAVLQWGLGEAALLSKMNMAASSPYLGAAVFCAAGIYQLTPLKQACLAHCRSPVEFISRHWRDGAAGALRMGVDHGRYCVGCCWFLMALLFFGGVMNLLWVAAIAVFVLSEKLLPHGEAIARASGVLMLGFAGVLLVRAWLT
jgi:predicted metal-binding membrane protein